MLESSVISYFGLDLIISPLQCQSILASGTASITTSILLVAPGATLVNGLTSFTILGALASGGRIFLTFGSSPGRAGSTLIRKSDLQTPVLFFASMAYSPSSSCVTSITWRICLFAPSMQI